MICTCKFCKSTFKRSGRAYLANPFCGERVCYEARLEASGAIDLRDNHRVSELGNGYVRIEPIDRTKLFKAARVSKLLECIRPLINPDFIIVNPDGKTVSRKDISEHLGVSYSYGCKLLRDAIDNREIAESKIGPYTMFIANPFVLCDNPQATPTLTAIFKGRCADE